MPTYNLVEARRFANFHLDQGRIAQINQVSEHKFEVQLVETDAIYEFDEPKPRRERFVFNQGWLTKTPESASTARGRLTNQLQESKIRWIALILCLSAFVAMLMLLIQPNQGIQGGHSASSEPTIQAQSEVCKQPSELSQTEVATLIATGELNVRSANFHQLEKLELGGVEQLKLNFTCKDETIYGSLALIKRSNTWQIEKWVPLN
ncbi:MAG: hypothetical protein RL556_23 [Actinomycetota bacterium]|jgi:hypothetical protein